MKQTESSKEEGLAKVKAIDADIELAKEKIIEALNCDLGALFNVDVSNGVAIEILDFTHNFDVIPFYIREIKNLHESKRELSKNNLISRGIKIADNFTSKQEPMQAVCQSKEAKSEMPNQMPDDKYKYSSTPSELQHKENVEHRRKILKEIIGHFNSPFLGILKMEDESEIKIGDRVKLKGDSNSPIMTVTADIGENAIASFAAQNNGIAIGKNVQQNTAQYDGVLECSVFADKSRPDLLTTHRIHKDALERLTPVQPTNKQ